MHGYIGFNEDVEMVFSKVIAQEKPKIRSKTNISDKEYAIELIFKNSTLGFGLDRMDLQCYFIDSKMKKFHIFKIIQFVYPDVIINNITETPPQTRDFVREQLVLYADIIEKYLIKVLKGDFTWVNQYYTGEKEESALIAELYKLSYGDSINQKYIKGDESWKIDLRERKHL